MHRRHTALYLEVIFAVYSKPMTEHVPGDHHVGFHTIHGQAVHAQELWQEGVAMAFHYELDWRTGREGRLRGGEAPRNTGTTPGQDAL